jgi:fluoride exporter
MSFVALWAGVGVLGGLGALARFELGGLFTRRSPAGLPLGTLAVNLTGTLLLGVLVGAGVSGDGYLLAGTATLGSYTTFSTWMFESHREAGEGRRGLAVGLLLGSLALGLGAAQLGRLIGGG